MNEVRHALSSHDTESPLSAAELNTVASEIEEGLIDNECNFSHPDWRIVDGLRALARLQHSTTSATTPEKQNDA